MYFDIAAFAALVTGSIALAVPAAHPEAAAGLATRSYDTFSHVNVFTPPRSYIVPRTLYARTALLPNGDLLSTWENYSDETLEKTLVYFPIYKSTNGGRSWKHISNVTDTVNKWGLRYQPDIYVLPQRIGNLPAGTILCSGNSIPTDLSKTKIDVYASFDGGYHWTFISSVASGGVALPNNGETPVWEPFMMVYNNKLVCYYSDQRDPAHGQKLVHQVSSDAKTWGPIVDDVRYSEYTARPGMTTVAHLPNGKWMMTYEYGGGPGFSDYQFPIYYRISDSPLTFDSAAGHPIVVGGFQPKSTPYLVWSSCGGVNGTLAVSGGHNTEVYLNTKLGDAGAWTALQTPQDDAYTRHLRVLPNQRHLLIMGGGRLGGDQNSVSLSVVSLP